MLADQLGVTISQGTLSNLIERCVKQLAPLEELTKQALALVPLLHPDEAGLYVAGKRSWLYVRATETLAHYVVHPTREVQALQTIGILEDFAGVSVYDDWQSYWQYDCGHGLCNVHVLRDLTLLAFAFGFAGYVAWSTCPSFILDDLSSYAH